MAQKYVPTKWVARETIGTAEVMNNIEQGIVGAYDEMERVNSQLAHNANKINYLNNANKYVTPEEFTGSDEEKILQCINQEIPLILFLFG